MIGEPWADYGLIDSGHGRKLERYGRFRFIRPEAQALWAPARPDWRAQGEFVPGSDEDGGGQWKFAEPVPRDGWPLKWEEVSFTAQTTPFRHLGFFPDMAPVWRWMREQVADLDAPECMNLFGYTGVGTLSLAAKGARMVHVDASKKSVEAARGNAALSGMSNAPVRWIIDDAAKFVAREARRGRRYDGILLDPPKFGRGPNGETWDLFANLPDMLKLCRDLLKPQTGFLILTAYAIRASFLSVERLCSEVLGPGVEAGELALRDQAGGLLATSLFCRWRAP